MRIIEARRKAGFNQKQFMEALRPFDRRLDWPTVSKYEKGHCYPTPKQTYIICTVTGATLGELASPEDVRFCAQVVRSAVSAKRAPNRTKAARIQFRVLESERPQIDDALRICGYATLQSWGDKVKTDLLGEAARKTSEREFPPECSAQPIDMNDPIFNPYFTEESQ